MRHVMGRIMHEPTLHMVQTLECLTVYWFGLGDAWKGDMCHGMIPDALELFQYTHKEWLTRLLFFQ